LIGWKNASDNPKVASVRIRCLEPLGILQGRDYPVELFQKRRNADYQVVVFNKVYDQDHLDLALRLKKQGVKVVLDLCDNHLYNPHNDKDMAAKSKRLLQMLEIAHTVTVPCVEMQRILPVASHIVRDGVRPLSKSESWQRGLTRCMRRHQRNLVWFGNWGGCWRSGLRPGGMSELLAHQEKLVDLAKRYDMGLTIISNNRKMFGKLFGDWDMPVYYEEWGSDQRLRRNLARFDVCLLPISEDPFTICKSNNRLTLALYLGLPVIADAIPGYREFAPYCVVSDWENGLEGLVTGRQMPATAAGKEYVENNYMTVHAANDWQKFFDQVRERG
jgi:hypothetical protein